MRRSKGATKLDLLEDKASFGLDLVKINLLTKNLAKFCPTYVIFAVILTQPLEQEKFRKKPTDVSPEPRLTAALYC